MNELIQGSIAGSLLLIAIWLGCIYFNLRKK